MTITPVRRDQFDTWRELRELVFTDLELAFHDEEMEWLFASKDAGCFLMFAEDGEVIGLLELTLRNFVDGCIGGPVGYIDAIFIQPHHRGRGHGERLITFAFHWFGERGCKHVATDAEIDNVGAQEFHRRMGFTERWRIVGFTRSLPERFSATQNDRIDQE